MSRKARSKDEDFGLKKSSGVNYGQVLDRQIDDDRFERQRAIRVGAAPVRSALLSFALAHSKLKRTHSLTESCSGCVTLW